jgi:hypothetical protein
MVVKVNCQNQAYIMSVVWPTCYPHGMFPVPYISSRPSQLPRPGSQHAATHRWPVNCAVTIAGISGRWYVQLIKRVCMTWAMAHVHCMCAHWARRYMNWIKFQIDSSTMVFICIPCMQIHEGYLFATNILKWRLYWCLMPPSPLDRHYLWSQIPTCILWIIHHD